MSGRSGAALLFPERKRCRTCRSYFGFVVIDLMYDSYICAGRPDPWNTPPDEWPREHRSWRRRWDGKRLIVPKADWGTWRRAERAAKKRGKTAYRCTFCNGLHIGSTNPNGAQES